MIYPYPSKDRKWCDSLERQAQVSERLL